MVSLVLEETLRCRVDDWWFYDRVEESAREFMP
jgi:hypothetical protein